MARLPLVGLGKQLKRAGLKVKKVTNARELAWAAGLFEGEGCFFLKKGRNAGASLTMTDEEPVRRFHAAVGMGRTHSYAGSTATRKTTWTWTVHSFEGVQAVAALLWFGLGPRRRGRVAEVLQASRTQQPAPALRTHCPQGHLYDDANTYVHRYSDSRYPNGRVNRQCRTCKREGRKEKVA